METIDLQMFDDTVKYGDDQTIFIQPVCDLFGISYKNQRERILSDPILKFAARKNGSIVLFGDEKERICLTKRGFLRWIQLLNPATARENMRDTLLTYQVQIFDYLFEAAIGLDEIREKTIELMEWRQAYSAMGNRIQARVRELQEMTNQQLGIDPPAKRRIGK